MILPWRSGQNIPLKGLIGSCLASNFLPSPIGLGQSPQSPTGEHILPNRSSYLRLRGSEDEKLRRAVESAYLERLKSLETTFGILLTRRIEADLTIAKQQKFRDGIEAQLSARDFRQKRNAQ